MKTKMMAVPAALVLSFLIIMPVAALPKEVPGITKGLLRTMLDKPDVVILDVRLEREWKSTKFRIKGAVWENPKKIDSWAGKYNKDLTLIFY
ncbi:rhodanese-like domain-containing protein [Thermodesulfobacteriota bacterium]